VVWALLLDPQVMGGCVPGMQSIEVLSPTEYKAVMHVKIAFISAKFKLKTRIVEQRAPQYLRTEGTGEDASVASSLKQQSEIFLTELADGGTELRIKVKVDVLGRLGSFGLSVMKTKADRLWDEFGQNLLARLAPAAPATADQPAAMRSRRPRPLSSRPLPSPHRCPPCHPARAWCRRRTPGGRGSGPSRPT
jgi:carbon monoxide dehydrogenase subunit G